MRAQPIHFHPVRPSARVADVAPSTGAPAPDDRRQGGALKGRGTATRLAHRFEAWARQRETDGWEGGSGDDAVEGSGRGCEPVQRPPTELQWQDARSILSRNDSPDVPFELAINPYRGCEHGCIYCYARPTHSYLNLSPGLDFETQILAKRNAAELLRKALARAGYEAKIGRAHV